MWWRGTCEWRREERTVASRGLLSGRTTAVPANVAVSSDSAEDLRTLNLLSTFPFICTGIQEVLQTCAVV